MNARIGRIVWSFAVHAAIVVALLQTSRNVLVRAAIPGTSQGSRIELTYLPGGASAATPNKSKSETARKSKVQPAKVPDSQVAKITLPTAPPLPAQNTVKTSPAPSSGQSGAESNDALGTDNIQIALTTYSPSPKPDLSQMPRGTQGDVVVDITIDPTGNVADLQILHALGYGVEGKVAETVRTWKFHPATKDGVPVASVQELHFHYGPV